MVTNTGKDLGERYRIFLSWLVRYIRASGFEPFFLLHDDVSDRTLAERIRSEAGFQIPIECHDDPLRLKSIVRDSYALVSSRFHGVVNGLSQGIPTMGTSWSHKYEMLFKEYGIPEGCLSVSIESKVLKKQIQRITNDDSRKEMITKITKASNMYKEQTEEMWKKVFSVIEK